MRNILNRLTQRIKPKVVWKKVDGIKMPAVKTKFNLTTMTLTGEINIKPTLRSIVAKMENKKELAKTLTNIADSDLTCEFSLDIRPIVAHAFKSIAKE